MSFHFPHSSSLPFGTTGEATSSATSSATSNATGKVAGEVTGKVTGKATGLVSPCISVCEIDEESGFCKGCHRTRAEIRGWSRGNRLDQLKIIEELRERRLLLGFRSRRNTRRRKL